MRQENSKQGILFTTRHDGAARRRLPRRRCGRIGRRRFPAQAEGSLIRRADGTIVGSRLIAQKFTRPEYFQPRPSAVDYNAASTGGTNYGPSNPDHLKAVQERLDAIIEQEGSTASQMPSEMVTASGAGMDPHIPPPRRNCRRRASPRRVACRWSGSATLFRPHGAADVWISRPGTRQRARAESGARRSAWCTPKPAAGK